MTRSSRRTLRLLDETPSSDLILLNKASAPTAPVLNEGQIKIIEDVWGHDMLLDKRKVSVILNAQQAINEESRKVLRASINMGRALLDAKQSLSVDEFNRGLRQSQKAWRGLSRGTVSKLMSVAQWWDAAILPEQHAPQSYSVLYEFTTLQPDEFQAAITTGVFRPDVTRNEVQGFKRRISSMIDGEVVEERPELDRLRERRRHLLEELLSIRRQLRALGD